MRDVAKYMHDTATIIGRKVGAVTDAASSVVDKASEYSKEALKKLSKK